MEKIGVPFPKFDKIDKLSIKTRKVDQIYFLALSLICAISLVTVWYYNENKPLNIDG